LADYTFVIISQITVAFSVKFFEEKTGTKKQIFLTMITILGLKKNFYSEELVDSEVVLKDLIL